MGRFLATWITKNWFFSEERKKERITFFRKIPHLVVVSMSTYSTFVRSNVQLYERTHERSLGDDFSQKQEMNDVCDERWQQSTMTSSKFDSYCR